VTLPDTVVYNSLISENDTLFVVPYSIVYGTTPSLSIDKTFIFSLIDPTTNATLGSTTAYPYYNYGYGQGLVSLYFASNNITWGSTYNFQVAENPSSFTTPQNFNFVIGTSSYSPYTSNHTANQALLQTKVTTIAQQLTIAWGMGATPLTEPGGSGTILSSYGEAYFRNAIYGLQNMCPSLFLLQQTNLDYTLRSWDYSFATLLSNTFAGSYIGTHLVGGFAGIWSVPTSTGMTLIALIVAMIVFGISVWASQGSPQGTQGAFLDMAVVIIFMTLGGFFSAIVAALFAFMFAMVGFWILLLNRA
jgi:hypothetical protein